MSALAERSRRTTAGRRATELAGDDLQNDETFWGHETWMEDDSGNESYRSSDENSDMKQDMFDSDFDESESDNEIEEAEAGEDAEKEIKRQERESARSAVSGRAYIDTTAKKIISQKKPANRGRGAKGGTKRLVGEGLNAGIILNIPISGVVSNGAVASSAPIPYPITPILMASPTKKEKRKNEVTAASFRPARQAIQLGRQVKSSLAAQAAAAASDKITSSRETKSNNKRKRRRYTQEELLLEAVSNTEPENDRWLLGRKRMQAESEKEKEATNRDRRRGKVIEKFVSRRGYLNSINFPDMDNLPTILSRAHDNKPLPKKPTICAITGKVARYLDPKTQMGYHDAAAFKELRRRYELNQASTLQGTVTNDADVAAVVISRPEVMDSIDIDVSTNNIAIPQFLSKVTKRPAKPKSSRNGTKKHTANPKIVSLSAPISTTFVASEPQPHTIGSRLELTLPPEALQSTSVNATDTIPNSTIQSVHGAAQDSCNITNELSNNIYSNGSSKTIYSTIKTPQLANNQNGSAPATQYNKKIDQTPSDSIEIHSNLHMTPNQQSQQSKNFQYNEKIEQTHVGSIDMHATLYMTTNQQAQQSNNFGCN